MEELQNYGYTQIDTAFFHQGNWETAEYNPLIDNSWNDGIGIVNYSIMGLIQIKLGASEQPDINLASALKLYDEQINIIFELMINKNHDYGEAWREMRVSSLTDLIYTRVSHITQKFFLV